MEIKGFCLGAFRTNCYLVENDGEAFLVDPERPRRSPKRLVRRSFSRKKSSITLITAPIR